MAEPPGAQPPLGIDAVEWLALSGNVLTVAVKGHWQRRASWRGRPILVVDVDGQHHRFRAIPEPPSVTGAAPGTWRMTFSLPADLASYLRGHAWLQLGTVVVPLPGVADPGVAPEAGGVVSREREAAEIQAPAEPERRAGAEGRPRSGQQRAESVLAAAAELSERIHQLERERRAAEHRANAEHSRRLELEEQQAAMHPKLTEAQSRVRELERELAEARRTRWADQLSAEIAVARALPPAVGVVPEPAPAGAELAQAQLEGERATVKHAGSGRTPGLQRQLRQHDLRTEQLYEVIDELRAVLDGIRGVPDEELAGAEQPGLVEPIRLDAALARLREEIPAPAPAPVDTSASEAGTAPGTDGEASAPHATASDADVTPVAQPTRKSWLLRALLSLAKQDPVAAGRIVLGLLPAQRLAYAEPVAYDLLLADAGCIQVTARGAATRVTPAAVARDLAEVDFRLTGELATLARLLIAGPVRRRSGRRMAELQGSRKSLRALVNLVRTPLGLSELYAAGMRLDVPLAFRLAAIMIDRKAVGSHRFTIAHRGPSESWYFRVSGAERPTVTSSPPLGPVATTIVSEPGALLGVIAGEQEPHAIIRGASEPLELLRDWVKQT